MMILYKNKKTLVYSLDNDTEIVDIVSGVL